MDIKQVKDLMKYLETSKLKKLVLKRGDFELHLEKDDLSPPPSSRTKAHEVDVESAFQSEMVHKERVAEAPGSYVESPMVGTFYSSPAPDQSPFVKVGDKVNEHTVVCVVEAMKVMNEVKAGISGTVAEILVDNAQPIEFGSRLIRIV